MAERTGEENVESPVEVSLHWLAAEGDHEKLEAVLKIDSSALEVADRHGQTPLNLAARLGLHTIVKVRYYCTFIYQMKWK